MNGMGANENAFEYYYRIISHLKVDGFQTVGVTIIHSYLSVGVLLYLLLLVALILRARPKAADNRFFALLLLCEAYKVTITWYYLYPFGPEILPYIQYGRVLWYFFAFLSFFMYLATPLFYPIQSLRRFSTDGVKHKLCWVLPLIALAATAALVVPAESITEAIGGAAYIFCATADSTAQVVLLPGTELKSDVICRGVDPEYAPYSYILTQQKQIASFIWISAVLVSIFIVIVLRRARRQLEDEDPSSKAASEARALSIGFTGKAICQGVTACVVIYISARFGSFSMLSLTDDSSPAWAYVFLLSMFGFMFSVLVTSLFEGFMFTYAIVKDDVFGIDEKLRRTFSATVFASTGGLLAIIASELMEVVFDAGWLGGVGIGILFLLMNKPIFALINRLSGNLMPEAYSEAEQSYLQAFAFATSDGELSQRDRAFLEMQASSLGLDPARVVQLEAESATSSHDR